ncbi:uncharacterized protein [Antedon mediterranea]|uniref:uncharacterized protein isoform X1 n=2 Tax=Antedon mediterranea TaxID=105859 RepID=UPI003AF45947
MLLGSVQLSGKSLSVSEVRDICDSLRSHSVRLLSLSGCQVGDKDFRKMMQALAECKTVAQLNLNLGVVCDLERVKMLALALNKNRSLTSLHLHGTPLGDKGLTLLIDSLCLHPGIRTLDLGDCNLGDEGIRLICRMLPGNGARPGLRELVLSANNAVTNVGWAHLATAIAVRSSLRHLGLDYNTLGDYGAGVFAVAAAACKTLQIIDLEGTGISEEGGLVWQNLLDCFQTDLTSVLLNGNNISTDTLNTIKGSVTVHEIPATSSENKDSDSDTHCALARGTFRRRRMSGGDVTRMNYPRSSLATSSLSTGASRAKGKERSRSASRRNSFPTIRKKVAPGASGYSSDLSGSETDGRKLENTSKDGKCVGNGSDNGVQRISVGGRNSPRQVISPKHTRRESLGSSHDECSCNDDADDEKDNLENSSSSREKLRDLNSRKLQLQRPFTGQRAPKTGEERDQFDSDRLYSPRKLKAGRRRSSPRPSLPTLYQTL